MSRNGWNVSFSGSSCHNQIITGYGTKTGCVCSPFDTRPLLLCETQEAVSAIRIALVHIIYRTGTWKGLEYSHSAHFPEYNSSIVRYLNLWILIQVYTKEMDHGVLLEEGENGRVHFI